MRASEILKLYENIQHLEAVNRQLVEALRELALWADTNDKGDKHGNVSPQLVAARAALKAAGGVK